MTTSIKIDGRLRAALSALAEVIPGATVDAIAEKAIRNYINRVDRALRGVPANGDKPKAKAKAKATVALRKVRADRGTKRTHPQGPKRTYIRKVSGFKVGQRLQRYVYHRGPKGKREVQTVTVREVPPTVRGSFVARDVKTGRRITMRGSSAVASIWWQA